MPIIKSAIKKLRKDKKRTKKNLKYINEYKKVFYQIKKSKDKKNNNFFDLIKKYYSLVDKAVKNKIIHKNKGNRLKSKVKIKNK
ncbi:MAG: 30S ribosomal protein S20 [Patescibacteria group bacterium]|nr:30S ribosomal protein S20 [Patescibacteria group bacterium]